MHPTYALSWYCWDIIARLHPDRVVTKTGGFKTIENRTKPIPHVIEQRDGCALICMTKKEPTRGHFESLRKQMLMTLEKYSRMYSDRAWEFMRSFCVAKYNWHVWGRIIGVCFFQNGGKRRHVTEEDKMKGGLPDFYWWIARKTILFPKWIAYFSCQSAHHKFQEQRVRDEPTCLMEVV